jgi:hypothetical protein
VAAISSLLSPDLLVFANCTVPENLLCAIGRVKLALPVAVDPLAALRLQRLDVALCAEVHCSPAEEEPRLAAPEAFEKHSVVAVFRALHLVAELP